MLNRLLEQLPFSLEIKYIIIILLEIDENGTNYLTKTSNQIQKERTKFSPDLLTKSLYIPTVCTASLLSCIH